MIEVELPDGRILEFPDGTPQETIQNVVQQVAQPEQQQSRSILQTVEDVGRSLAEGATLGGAGEVAAAGQTALRLGALGNPILGAARGLLNPTQTEQIFTQELAQQDARDREIPAGVAIPGQIAGGLAAAAIFGPGAAGTTASRTFPALLRGARVGAGTGAVAGALSAEGPPSQRLEGAVRGGVMGGALGAAAVPVTAAVGRGVRALAEPSARRATRRAAQKIEQAFERDQIGPTRAAARARTLGPQATVADVGGRNVQRLARGVTASPGAAERLAGRTLEGRALSQPSRIAQAVNRIRGGRNFASSVDDVVAIRRSNADELYAEALDQATSLPSRGRLVGNEITELIEDSPRVRAAIRQAKSFRRFRQLPDNDYRVLDQAYKNLGGQARAINREGNPVLAANMRNEASELLAAISDEVPAYRRAVEVFSDESSLLDALQDGRSFLRADSAVTRRLIQDMTDGEREMFTIGVGQALEDISGRVRSGADATRRLFATPEIRDKIRAALPDNRQFRQFQSTMLREAQFGQTRNAVLSGSRTATLQEDIADLAAPARSAIEATQAATVGGLSGLATNVIGQLGRRLTGADSGRLPEPVRDEIARLLLSAGGPQAVGNLSQEAQRLAVARALQRTIGLEGSFLAGQQSGLRLAPDQ
ncbi:MAG: hypothetical protein ACR2PW_04535 [Gammaproteobacteria bacterium]